MLDPDRGADSVRVQDAGVADVVELAGASSSVGSNFVGLHESVLRPSVVSPPSSRPVGWMRLCPGRQVTGHGGPRRPFV